MTLRDPFAGESRGAGRRIRWFALGSWLGLPANRPTAPGKRRSAPGKGQPGFRLRARYRRRLAEIERALMAETPALSSKFAVFNRLTAGERPAGAEQLPPRHRSRPRAVHLAILLALAAVTTMCVVLSTQMHPVAARPCPTSATAGPSVHGAVRGVTCPAYPAIK
jgi:hypothetical protein